MVVVLFLVVVLVVVVVVLPIPEGAEYSPVGARLKEILVLDGGILSGLENPLHHFLRRRADRLVVNRSNRPERRDDRSGEGVRERGGGMHAHTSKVKYSVLA